MSGKTRVMLVDDHAVVRMGFRMLLEATDDMTVSQREIFGPILPVRGYDNVDGKLRQLGAKIERATE